MGCTARPRSIDRSKAITQQKHSNFKQWAKQVSQEWKHVPTFKGKHYERNLFILKSLITTNSNGLSAWELALQYMKETEPEFMYWTEDTIFHRRASEHSKMNRRLKPLMEKEYVRKTGPIYSVSSKGFFMMFAIDPTIVDEITLSKWGMSWPEITWEKDTEDFLMNVKEITKTYGPQDIKEFFSDELTRETTSFVVRKSLNKWKINVDEISEAEFLKLIITKLKEWAGRKGLQLFRHTEKRRGE